MMLWWSKCSDEVKKMGRADTGYKLPYGIMYIFPVCTCFYIK